MSDIQTAITEGTELARKRLEELLKMQEQISTMSPEEAKEILPHYYILSVQLDALILHIKTLHILDERWKETDMQLMKLNALIEQNNGTAPKQVTDYINNLSPEWISHFRIRAELYEMKKFLELLPKTDEDTAESISVSTPTPM